MVSYWLHFSWLHPPPWCFFLRDAGAHRWYTHSRIEIHCYGKALYTPYIEKGSCSRSSKEGCCFIPQPYIMDSFLLLHLSITCLFLSASIWLSCRPGWPCPCFLLLYLTRLSHSLSLSLSIIKDMLSRNSPLFSVDDTPPLVLFWASMRQHGWAVLLKLVAAMAAVAAAVWCFCCSPLLLLTKRLALPAYHRCLGVVSVFLVVFLFFGRSTSLPIGLLTDLLVS